MRGSLEEQLKAIAADLGGDRVPAVQLERPRNPSHGDLATNLAMTLAGILKRPPRDIADTIVSRIDLASAGLSTVEVAGPGFLNFRFAQASLHEQLAAILEADTTYGRSAGGGGRRVQVEFVSANPTGPLHVAHGRGAALGDAIAALLEWAGNDVTREFYVNDAGVQIDKLAESLEARWRELHGEAAAIPEGGYHGSYLQEMAVEVEAELGDRLRAAGADRVLLLRDWATARLREEQDRDLRDFGVTFDEYYLESRLYSEDKLAETLRVLAGADLTYEADGATWLRTSDFGDDKDRVLVKSDGSFTYFLPDLAYHREKARRGFEHVINVWGADHHGYVPRMQAALRALGLRDFLDVEIVQMVRFMRGGKEAKLSKRAGEYVTLKELADVCGTDVARYFFLMRRGDTQMLFDLDLALDHSERNPVYKVQYAHARMMSIFAKAGESAEAVRAGVGEADLDLLTEPVELDLIKQLAQFPDVVIRAAAARAPHMVCEYLETTAGAVNSWYHAGNPSRNPELAVLVEDPGLRAARFVLAAAVRTVLRNGLHLLGLNAPERMERESSE